MAKSNVLNKQHQTHFKWYMALILICLVAIAGIAFLYYSHAATVGKIAYSLNVGTATQAGPVTPNPIASQIFTLNQDGTQDSQVTHTLAANSGVKWSPDHTSLATVSAPGGVQAIFVQNADGTSRKAISHPSAGNADNYPRWSPDGSRLVFYRSGSNPGIYLVNKDGTGEKLVTYYPANTGIYMYWSPNNKTILYQYPYAGGYVSTINIDGTSGKQLTIPSCGIPLGWTPNGSRILYSAYTYANGSCSTGGQIASATLSIMGADGSSPQTLVANIASNMGVSYNPNGLAIAYITADLKSVNTVSPLASGFPVTNLLTLPSGSNFKGVKYNAAGQLLLSESNYISSAYVSRLAVYNPSSSGKQDVAVSIPSVISTTYYTIQDFDW